MSEEQVGWSIKKEISLGDIIAIVVAIVAVMSAYMTLNTRITVVEIMAQTNGASIAGTITEIKDELRRLNNKMERMFEDKFEHRPPTGLRP